MLRSLYLPIHLFLAVFGYGALFAAFTMGVLYLFQERELLSRSPRSVLLPDPEPRAVGHDRRAQRRSAASAS